MNANTSNTSLAKERTNGLAILGAVAIIALIVAVAMQVRASQTYSNLETKALVKAASECSNERVRMMQPSDFSRSGYNLEQLKRDCLDENLMSGENKTVVQPTK